MRLGSSIQDWVFGLVCTGFALTGLVLALAEGQRAGFAVFAFFGSGTAIWVWMLVRKRQIRAHAAAKDVRVRGYVPLRARRSSVLAWTGGLAAVGLAMAVTGSTIGVVFVWIGAGMAIVGTVLSVLLALGVFPQPFLQFEPTGLRLGQHRYSFLVEWDNLSDIAPGNVHGHDLLLLKVRDVDHLGATLQPPSTGHERLAKLIRSNRQWFDADVAIMTMQYGTDMALLAHAIKRYVTDPSSRDELQNGRELPSASSEVSDK